MTELDTLFRPGSIGSLELKNRIVKSPQTSALSNQDGTVTPRLVNHYKRLAEGGIGLVMVEYTYVDDDASKSIHAQLGISRREHVAGLGWLVDEVHAAGAKVGIQLEHCGRQKFLGVQPIKTASDVSWDAVEVQYGERPQVMTLADIDAVVAAFGEAAERAYLARFDLVELHAGHGYLFTNFLSPHTNKRTDEYGGSFENRARLLLRAVAEVRGKVPPDFPVSVRLSVTDYEPDGIEIEETVELCRLLERAGVDVIHASGGHHARMEYEVSPWSMPRALHRWGWEQIKAAVSIPVIASGSLVSPAVAAEQLAAGADFVSLGRAMLADPDWTNKAKAGRVLDIVPCIRCNDGCLQRGLMVGRSVGCTVNPQVGEEYRFPVEPAPSSKQVAVVGGGPAGLRAAAVLADRGHVVTLYEGARLGGRLAATTRSPYKQDQADLLAHLVHQVESRSVTVVHERASAGTLAAAGHEVIVVATGSRPRLPFEGVRHAVDVDDPQSLPSPVVVVGGGLTGAETALWLASAGHTDVVIAEAGPALLANGEVFTDAATLPGLLAEQGVDVRVEARVVEVDSSSVTVETAKGREEIKAATVLLACGYEAAPGLADELRTVAPAVETVVIGGAARSGRLHDSLHDAYFTARLL
jgi:2,4-dienoyl-CoA reductase-like NADH-dependent reductase (Old Yellow Enzyme family)/thioredoxin reductase